MEASNTTIEKTEPQDTEIAETESLLNEDMKDDTPGVKGEVMLINTDSFEECNHDMNTLYNKSRSDEQLQASISTEELTDKEQALSVSNVS